MQGYRLAHFIGAGLCFTQTFCNLVVGFSNLDVAPDHLKLNKELFVQVVYACNLIGIVFYYIEGVADIFMQQHMFMSMLAKWLGLALSLIIVLALLVMLAS